MAGEIHDGLLYGRGAVDMKDFAGMLLAIPTAEFGWPLWAALLLAFGVALIVGFLNGYLVVRTGIPSFLITLSTFFMLRGVNLGTTKAIWLPRGLTRDYGEFGTRGHVDIVAAFAGPGTVLLHRQDNPAHPDYEVYRELSAVLAGEVDAKGRPLRVIDVPAPTVLEDGDIIMRAQLFQRRMASSLR